MFYAVHSGCELDLLMEIRGRRIGFDPLHEHRRRRYVAR